MKIGDKSSVRTTFIISFISIFIFCLLLIGGFYSYKLIIKKISETKNENNYRSCLIDQKQADKTALSYVPIISKVNISSNANVYVEGRIAGFKDIEKLGVEFESPRNECMNTVVDFNNANGEFTIKANLNSREEAAGNCRYSRAEARFTLKPYDKNKVAVLIPNCNYQECDYSFDLSWIYIRKENNNDKWCMGGYTDIGLGSAPTWELTNEELSKIGLTKDNVCERELRGERPQTYYQRRERKCGEDMKKIPIETNNLIKSKI